MLLFVLAYLGGVLTIVSPCILPVLPFVFARAGRPFVRSTLPMLGGMATAFAGVASLATLGGGWVVQANSWGRIAALVVLAGFGLLLLFPGLAERAMRPVAALGARLTERASGGGSTVAASFLLGAATGLLWAPCAGPILGLILASAALQGATVQTSGLLLAYAAGAATSLALALWVGGRVVTAMKRSLAAGEWVRRGLGVLVLAGVATILLGLDTGLLARLSIGGTTRLEQALLDRTPGGGARSSSSAISPDGMLPVEGVMPSLDGATVWLNSPPLTTEGLRGKVVLIDFWTYSCINCLRSLPYVKAWAEKYRDSGLVVIGVHAPEFAFERDLKNVRKAVSDLGVAYPVAVDNDWTIWKAFKNQYWPAHYFVDGQGRVRYHHFGEGEYDRSERVIQQLLIENGGRAVRRGEVTVSATGVSAEAAQDDRKSEETYLGYGRARNNINPGNWVRDRPEDYTLVPTQTLNKWSLGGRWTATSEAAVLDRAGGRIAYRFHARDLHLVLAPAADGRPVRFRVLVDGRPPGADGGEDVDAAGEGVVRDNRLYQLVRQKGAVRERTFEIEFLDPGVRAFAFTFG